MSRARSLADHLAPDCISRLQRSAEQRTEDAKLLLEQKRPLAAIYFFGYSVEMCLCAAYYRSDGFSPNQTIDRDARQRRMARARQLRTSAGQPLMNSDPHPLVGWARFLEWHRSVSLKLTSQQSQLLKEAIIQAELVYKHWRPELRYKTAAVTQNQLEEVRNAASWFIQHRNHL